mmetsp:Transcript_27896/g.64619  ORF Transcript_27896/g.64619 Transcript_27896/m.64619 type:complete len:222 (+) Transcript_27896:786-1451(+)
MPFDLFFPFGFFRRLDIHAVTSCFGGNLHGLFGFLEILLVIIFLEHEPIGHFHYGTMAHVIRLLLPVNKQPQGRVGTNVFIQTQLLMRDTIHLANQDGLFHLLGMLQIFFIPILMLVIRSFSQNFIRYFVHDFCQCLPGRGQITTMRAPRCVEIHKDEFVIPFGKVECLWIQTDGVLAILVELLDGFRHHDILDYDIILLSIPSLIPLSHTIRIEMPFRDE